MRSTKWEHDCKACIWIESNERGDAYFCPNTKSILFRYGDQPEEYISSPVALAMAIREIEADLAWALERMYYNPRFRIRVEVVGT